MSEKLKEDTFASWFYPIISIIAFTFARQRGLERKVLNANPSSD